jgi:hypothetical protein
MKWRQHNGQWMRSEGALVVAVQRISHNVWGWVIESGPGAGAEGISESRAEAWRVAQQTSKRS